MQAFEHGESCAAIREAREVIRAADHLIIIYRCGRARCRPCFEAFFEQMLRPEFAFGYGMELSQPRPF